MSNVERKANLPAIIKGAEEKFTQLAKLHGVPDFTFAREYEFAMQVMNAKPYLQTVALGNPQSLKDAIINVAAIGLSLSPVHKLAYLVPRDKAICLDISYLGRIKLAVDASAIVFASPNLIHDNDDFEYLGPVTPPRHSFNHKKPRGAIVGVYTMAKLTSGDWMVDYMSIAKVERIRDRYSESWKAFKSKGAQSPWDYEDDEMVLKTGVKHAYKLWPKGRPTAASLAMAQLDEAERPVEEVEDLAPPEPNPHMLEGLVIIRELLAVLEREEPKYLAHLERTHNRKIEKLEDLTQLEIDQSVTYLQGIVDNIARKAKERAGGSNENAG